MKPDIANNCLMHPGLEPIALREAVSHAPRAEVIF
jgi:hypothetical protein